MLQKNNELVLVRSALKGYANLERAQISLRFFKTGPGQYGEGDVFLGLTVPDVRRIAKQFAHVSDATIFALLQSKFHEERLMALLILVHQFKRTDVLRREEIYKLYLAQTKYINNWDLVDISAEHIVGGFLEDKPKDVLYKLACSVSVWERRIAMLATFHYIKKGQSQVAFKVAELLLHDTHDLIHKAVGWMLREIGKRCSQEIEEIFLRRYYHHMPRTMLRYAIERFPEELRKSYLLGKI